MFRPAVVRNRRNEGMQAFRLEYLRFWGEGQAADERLGQWRGRAMEPLILADDASRRNLRWRWTPRTPSLLPVGQARSLTWT